MTIIDFLIGLTLMNAMPHFVLGVWGGRILGGFGFGNKQNIAYGLLNFVISVALFIYKYGPEAILENGIYAGALFILVVYFLSSRFLYRLFSK